MKIGICGTGGTGKSTEAFKLCLDYKMKHPDKTVGLFLECVGGCPLPEKDKNASLESELWIFSKQIEHEIYLKSKYDIVICDRTVLDPIPYTYNSVSKSLANSMLSIAKEFIHTYDTIIFKTMKFNDFNYDDGFRDTDNEYRKYIEDCFIELFRNEFGINIPSDCEPQEFKHDKFDLIVK